MRLKFKTGEKGILIAKALGMTMLAFVLSWLFVAPFSASTSSIFSSPEKTDFILSDFYAQVADRRPVRKLSDRLVVIDIDRAGRDEIADLIAAVGLCDPAAVAVDINFEEAREDNTHLLEAISGVKRIVLPVGMSHTGSETDLFEIEEKPFFYSELPGVEYGASNLPGKFEGATIREFRVDYPLAGGGEQLSMVSAVAKMVDPEAYKALRARGKELETIDYPSREITVMSMDEFYAAPESAVGKVVMIGAVNEASDMHGTPVRSQMAGIMIHAQALSTVMEGSYYTKPPLFSDYAAASLLCFIMILMSIGMTGKFKGCIIRIVQVAFVYIAIRVGYALYVDHRVILDFGLTLLMIAFGTFAIDIWNGLEGLLGLALKGWRKVWGMVGAAPTAEEGTE